MTRHWDPLADLTVLMGGARGLALRVWGAGWRPPACALCGYPGPIDLCGPCNLAESAMRLGLNPTTDDLGIAS